MLLVFTAVSLFQVYACRRKASPVPAMVIPAAAVIESVDPGQPVADAATIMARPEVPVLCYHQIREWRGNESRGVKDVVVPPALFKSQLQLLADSGYQTVLPDELYAYLTTGKPLPPKPVMLTYDDSDLDQYKIAAPEMKKHGFKGVFLL